MQLNASRLKVLQAQDDLIGGMRETAEKQLATVNSTPTYEKLLKDLIVQASNWNSSLPYVASLNLDVRIMNNECDACHILKMVSLWKFSGPSAFERAICSVATYVVFCAFNVLFCRQYLNWFVSWDINLWSNGGVVLASKDGRIVCENTLDARLGVVFKQNLPEVY